MTCPSPDSALVTHHSRSDSLGPASPPLFMLPRVERMLSKHRYQVLLVSASVRAHNNVLERESDQLLLGK